MGIDPFTGAVIAGIGGSLIGSRASKKAANTVAGASDAATAEQRRQFDIATGLMRPSIDAGNQARDQLMQLLGLGRGTAGAGTAALGTQVGSGGFPMVGDPLDIIKNTPGYQFQINERTRALNANRSNAGPTGGELMKDFSNYVHGATAGQFYQDYANRLANLAGTGQMAASNQGALGVQTGANIGNTLQNAGMARASGIIGSGNAFGNLFNDIGGYIGQYGWPWQQSNRGSLGGSRNPGE